MKNGNSINDETKFGYHLINFVVENDETKFGYHQDLNLKKIF